MKFHCGTLPKVWRPGITNYHKIKNIVMVPAHETADMAHGLNFRRKQWHQFIRSLWLELDLKICCETTNIMKPRFVLGPIVAVFLVSTAATVAQFIPGASPTAPFAQPVVLVGVNMPYGGDNRGGVPVYVTGPIYLAKDQKTNFFDAARSISSKLLQEKNFDLGLDQNVPEGKLGSTVHVLSGPGICAFACSLRYGSATGDPWKRWENAALLDFDELESLLSTEPVVTTFKPDPAATSDSLSFKSRNGQLSLRVSGTNFSLSFGDGHTLWTSLSDSPKVYVAIRKARDKLVDLGAIKN